MTEILVIIGGFLSGSVMYASLIPRLFLKRDIENESDDRNPGAGNVFKLCGVFWGFLCLFFDLGKGVLPVLAACSLLDPAKWWFSLAIFAPVLGHAIAPLNRFHGGKCVAVSFGSLLGLLPVSYIVFVLAAVYILFSTRLKIDPHRRRSAWTFFVFGVLAAAFSLWQGLLSVAIGAALIAVTGVLKHTRYALDALPAPAAEEEEETERA